MPDMKMAAPAKINLHLHVGDRRPDGFHDIESLFLALDFGDTLWFETLPAATATEICMAWRLPEGPERTPRLPPEENIVYKAVSLFRARTGYDDGLRITVEKRIPLGGGLGGGSGQGNPNALKAYLAQVRKRLNSSKKYPSSARSQKLEGVATVSFILAPDGRVISSRLVKSSGHAVLDEEVMALLRRVSPLPRRPKNLPQDNLSLTVPIQYSLR